MNYDMHVQDYYSIQEYIREDYLGALEMGDIEGAKEIYDDICLGAEL
jgi:hypothetical protein